jgi:hypothetical protein
MELQAAITVQCFVRMIRGRKVLAQLRKERDAVIRVQRLFRGFIVRNVRYWKLHAIHSAWNKAATRLTARARGWTGRLVAGKRRAECLRREFERRQLEEEVLRAVVHVEARRCHFHFRGREGRARLAFQEARLKSSGFYGRLRPRGYRLADKGLLREGIRPLFQLFDRSGTGYLDADEVRELLGFLCVKRPEAEGVAVRDLTDDPTQRLASFAAVCKWFRQHFRYEPTGLSLLRYRLKVWRWGRGREFSRRSLARQQCMTTRRRVGYVLQAYDRPATSFACCQCRKHFLLFREFLAHFISLVPGSRPDLCPVTGRQGLIFYGYYGDRSRFATQRRLNKQFERCMDETDVLELQRDLAEVQETLRWKLPKGKVDLRALARGVMLDRSQDDPQRPGTGGSRPGTAPSVLDPRRRSSVISGAPAARRAHGKARAFVLPSLPRWDLSKVALPRGASFKKALVRASKNLFAQRPWRRSVIKAIFDVFSGGTGGADVDVVSNRDMQGLLSALRMKFLKGVEVSDLALRATLAPEGALGFSFEVFHAWYLESHGKLFRHAARLSLKQLPAYVVRLALTRHARLQAQVSALEGFRKVRGARMDGGRAWSLCLFGFSCP